MLQRYRFGYYYEIMCVGFLLEKCSSRSSRPLLSCLCSFSPYCSTMIHIYILYIYTSGGRKFGNNFTRESH